VRINPEKKEEKERTRLALLRVTLRLAAAHGFVSLGLREVSRASGIAPTSFYRHFADMEELGLALIQDVASRFLAGWVARAQQVSLGGETLLETLLRQALAGVVEDPELMRFIVAERVGAIPAFRAAIREQLSIVSLAARDALRAELSGDAVVAAPVADAAVVLLLETCAEVLDRGPDHLPELRDRLVSQLRTLVAGLGGLP
jgi:AcrR family transcriptional regulator